MQIGIHETFKDYLENIDNDGNVIFNETDYPLMFSLQRYYKKYLSKN